MDQSPRIVIPESLTFAYAICNLTVVCEYRPRRHAHDCVAKKDQDGSNAAILESESKPE